MKYLSLILLFVFSSCNSQSNSKDKSFQASIERGKVVYTNFCVTCHLDNGKGVPRAFPPLADADYLRDKREESIKAIKYGQSGEIIVNGVTYKSSMAPLGLSDKEVADVMNYITNTWGNKNDKMITVEEVSKIKE